MPINFFIATGEITKKETLSMTLHKPTGEENMYVQLGYSPLMILNHICGQVSGSMYTDTINMIHTSQQSTKYGLK